MYERARKSLESKFQLKALMGEEANTNFSGVRPVLAKVEKTTT